MPKIRVEIEVPSGEYCDYEDTVCPACLEGNWCKCYCAIFGNDLEIDYNNYSCIRCDKCKQSEVQNDT